MKNIKISLDKKSYNSKPDNMDVKNICSRIAKNTEVLNTADDLKKAAQLIGSQGYTFSPATFTDGSKKIDSFEQMQLMVLDFDGNISFDEVKSRADKYELPPLFAYATFSSVDNNRFRVVFLNDLSINDKLAAKIYKNTLMTIFPECDKTDSDISKMYYGGKKLLLFNDDIPTINMESSIRNMVYYLKDKYGPTHYKQHIRSFAKANGIRLNDKGLLDISETEQSGASSCGEDGKISPKPFILFNAANGENLPIKTYRINLEGERSTNSSSVSKKCPRNHNEYRSDVIRAMESKCRLFKEFSEGNIKLHHDELFGLSTNIIHVETGISVFRSTLTEFPEHYEPLMIGKWDRDLKYNKDMDYQPMNCDKFCAYKDICNHGRNILSTVKPRRGMMERLSDYEEKYYSIEEMQESLSDNLIAAVNANDSKFHIIKAQTAAGKTEAYLRLMNDSDKSYLIAVPTNKLKRDIKKRAKEMKIEITVSPSVDEIKDEIPEDIWEEIQELRSTGQHSQVHQLICRMAEEENIECFKKYLEKQGNFEDNKGHAITTHRKLLNMDRRMLDKYDVVIIDEDIVLSSIATNQCEIAVSDIKRLIKLTKDSTRYQGLYQKLVKLMKSKKESKMIKLQGFQWDCKEDDESDKKNTCYYRYSGILPCGIFYVQER